MRIRRESKQAAPKRRVGCFLKSARKRRVFQKGEANRPAKIEPLIAQQIALLREATAELDEPKMRTGVLAVIASMTRDRQDLDDVFHEIFQLENGSRSPIIAVIVSILAEVKQFDPARVCAERVTDAYWKSQAWTAIAGYSGDVRDLQMASRAAKEIFDSRKQGVLAEICHVSKHQHPKKKQPTDYRALFELYESLGCLLNALRALSAFNQTNVASEELRGARQRLLAESIVLGILAKQIR